MAFLPNTKYKAIATNGNPKRLNIPPILLGVAGNPIEPNGPSNPFVPNEDPKEPNAPPILLALPIQKIAKISAKIPKGN